MNYTSALKTNDSSKFYPETEINQIHGFTDGFFDVVDNTTFLCGDSSSWKKGIDGGEIVYAPVDCSNYGTNNGLDTLSNIDDYISFDTSNTTAMNRMFRTCQFAAINVSHFNTSNVTNMQSMFSQNPNLASIDLRNFDTSNVTNIASMFQNCSSLKTTNLSGWDLSELTNLSYLFSGCSSLESINLSGWNLPNSLSSSYNQNVTANCTSLKSLNLSNSTLYSIGFVGSLVQYAKTSIEHIDLSGTTVSDATSGQFCNGCTSLKTIDFTGFTYPTPPRYQSWFNNCSQLESLGDIVFDFLFITSTSYVSKMFYGCTTLGENQATLKFKNVKQSVFTDEATLRTRASIPEGCSVQIQNWI